LGMNGGVGRAFCLKIVRLPSVLPLKRGPEFSLQKS